MKQLISICLALVLLSAFAGVRPKASAADLRVALVSTRYDMDEGGYAREVYDAAETYCEAHGIKYCLYWVEDDYTEMYAKTMKAAIADGNNVML